MQATASAKAGTKLHADAAKAEMQLESVAADLSAKEAEFKVS